MTSKREAFAALHVPGDPVLLYNIWDVSSAKAVASAGAKAIATGSHGVAEAAGFEDGEDLPLDLAIEIAGRIVDAVELPVTVDFEGAYAAEPEGVEANARRLARTGAVGCNFEDQVIGGEGLFPIARQAARVAAAVASGLWVNARTDIFLKRLVAGEDPNDRSLLGEALERGAAFAEAGAGSFFVPGVSDLDLIADICAASPIPVNVIKGDALEIPALAAAGVGRISWGPRPWRWAMQRLTDEARTVFDR